MKRALILAALFAPMAAANTAPDDPLIGRWRTERQNGVVEIKRCGNAICGYVVDGAPLRVNPDQRDIRNKTSSLRGRKIMGLKVLHGFTGGPREWTGGPVYDPDTGDGASRGTITLVGSGTIKIKGCVAFICRTQTWRSLAKPS